MSKDKNINIGEKDNVFIVEDDKYTRIIIEKLLLKNNYNVKSATNGKDALDIIDKFSPKVIIADWNMPIINGFELCKLIKKDEKYKTIYFILFTANILLEDRVKGLDAGADDFITKPIENAELLARVRTGIRVVDIQNELKRIEHDKAVVEMACTLGHKINNPLNSLTFSIKNLKDKLGDKEQEDLNDDLSIISLSIKNIEELISELIKLEKPQLIDYSSDSKMIKLD